MPRPLTKSQRYMPGLDGLRAIAVLAVIAYHLGVSWLPGGLLGVGVFFTLSGYLITDLLLTSWRSTGTLQLRTFWVHRARRLLPALFVMLPVVVVWVAIADPRELGALQGQAIASVFYVANWWLMARHVSYFARFGPPSPLGHLWSLSVEEQFYLVWPWLLALGLAAATRWRRSAVAGGRSAGGRSAVAGGG
ncbi:MAG: acyltransferase, partial [Actinomycetota bacterium]|nr:acyltransferase [Actinomycetota bacterium]